MMKKLLKSILLASLLFATYPLFADSSNHIRAILNHSYICHFGRYGVVTIDTRDPGASITVHGIRYPAKGGSYFYQTDDGKLTVAFNPEMTTWTYLSAEESAGIADSHCKVISNKKKNW
ncbi:hypothetical protein OKW45_000390 [Paraburkholderia sp. WSM4175]|uniref:hypothetical protein n=1 Tax=Paraburkholderia sp. WSM4175 TaxID=2991072 RepID=UPI003D1CA439